jgi:hypothetical protein
VAAGAGAAALAAAAAAIPVAGSFHVLPPLPQNMPALHPALASLLLLLLLDLKL